MRIKSTHSISISFIFYLFILLFAWRNIAYADFPLTTVKSATTDWIFPNTVSSARNYLDASNVLERDGNIASVASGSGLLRVINFDSTYLPNDAEINKIEMRFHLAGVRTTYRFQHNFGDCIDHEHPGFYKDFIPISTIIINDYIVNYTNEDCSINEEYIMAGDYAVEIVRYIGIANYKVDDISVRFTYTYQDVPEPTPTPTVTPLILIPGIAGSELKTGQEIEWSQPNGHGETFTHTYPAEEPVWLNLFEALKFGNDDYFDILRMNPDGQTSQANLVLNGTFVPLAYGGFIDFFIDNGYELDKDLFIFPYDWRKDISLTSPLLDQKIEFIKQQTGSDKIDIVTHSMGGLVAKNYISDPNRSKNVQKLITLGAPNLGATEFIKNLMYGGCLSKDPFKKPICFGVSPNEVKDIVQNMISGFELAPSQTYFDFYSGLDNNHPYPFADMRDIDSNGVTGKLNYSQIKTLLTNLEYNTSLFGPSEAFHVLDNNLINTNGVEVANIVGSGRSTLGQIIEKAFVNFLGIKIFKKDEVHINGDETVPLFSASLIDSSKNKSLLGNAKVFYTKQEHGNLAALGPALNLVKNILNNNIQLPAGVSIQAYSFSGTQVSVHSPVNIHVYDSIGNHTGPTPDGDFEVNIPGSSYDTLDDAKFIFLHDNGIYSIKFEATDQGSFDFRIRRFENDTISQETLYKDIPLTISTKADAQLDTSSIQSPIIHLDEDGDLIIDEDIGPSSNLTGDAIYDQVSPQTETSLSGVLGNNSWYKSDVIATLSPQDEEGGSGILKTEYSLDNGVNIDTYIEPFTIDSEKINKLKFRAIDKAGNEEDPKEIGIKLDKTKPDILANIPLENGIYLLNQNIQVDYSCSDDGSGLESCAVSQNDNNTLETSSVGVNKFEINASDNAGNKQQKTISYKVQYANSGICLNNPGHVILQPINSDGTSVFKQGGTIPAKFRVCDINGVSIGSPDLIKSFNLVKTISGTTVSNINESVNSTTPESSFHWDVINQQWIFNMSTKNLNAGKTYFYRIGLNDLTNVDFAFGLR